MNNFKILQEDISSNILQKVKSKTWVQAKNIFKDAWKKFSTYIKEQNDKALEDKVISIINKHMDSNYKSLADIDKEKLTEDVLTESIRHWWKKVRGEIFPTLSFYPALQAWLEIDKLIKGDEFSGGVIGTYSCIWLFIVSGKYILEFKKWKKQNPEEHEKEKIERKDRRKQRVKKLLRKESVDTFKDYLAEWPYIDKEGKDYAFDLELEKYKTLDDFITALKYMTSGDQVVDKHNNFFFVKSIKGKAKIIDNLINNDDVFKMAMSKFGIKPKALRKILIQL